MGREFHEHSDDVEVESYHHHHPHLGCMGAIFNVLDYHHHWYTVKKKFPHKKYSRGRHAKCCVNPQTISMEREPVETQGLLDGEADQIQVQQQTKKTSSTNKSSGSKGLTGKAKTKADNRKHWILGFSDRPKLQQTGSSHHLEPSGLGWINPIILVRKRADPSDTTRSASSLPATPRKHSIIKKRFNRERGTRTLINQKPVSEKLDKEVPHNQVKEGVDVLEIFKVNKDLFLDILQGPEVGISQHFPGNQTSKTVKLMKSGSFPVPGSPRVGYLRSSTLDHKMKEFWAFKKREKPVPGTQLSMPRASKTESVMNRLKDIKKRIKQALKERKKSINHTIADGLTLQVSSIDNNQITMEQDSISNLNGRVLNRMTRTKSINESLDRYTQLFENSVSKVADLDHSKSLKLTTDDKSPSRGRVPKFVRRISSLSDLDSFCSLLHELSRDALSSETSIRSILTYDAKNESDAAHVEPHSISFPESMDKFELVEAVLEAELQEKIAQGNYNCGSKGLLVDRNGEEITETSEFDEDIAELETVFAINPSRELVQPTSESSDILSSPECTIPEGLGLNHPNLPTEEVESVTMGISSRFLFFESDRDEADPCYNYVRDILELSGFIQSECLQTWYTADQPLNPSLFKDLEILLHPELDEDGSCNCDHQLVFGLVNEALVEISEKSSIYFPKPFSFNCCCTSLMLKGDNVVQEVWTKVSRNLAFQPQSDQSLDDIVARDLAKDAWLNLQAESEFVALELEDLIFDELLDELLS